MSSQLIDNFCMKTHSHIQLALLIFFGGLELLWSAPGVNPPIAPSTKSEATPFAIVARDANSRVWERMALEIGPSGKREPKKHYFTEIATGMHYQKDGKWAESSEQIDILPNGTAVAIHGQHQVTFPGDLYKGIVELITPDGRHLKSRPMGLSYFDGTNNVLIAELKSCAGVVIGKNQVVYYDAFTDFRADLVYTYTKAGLEQDVVIKEQPPLPEKYSLNLASTRLQLLTEFFDTASPGMVKRSAGERVGLKDDTLSFGEMRMVKGKAFSFGDAAPAASRSGETAVYKSWELMEGRTFLVEELPVPGL